MLVLLIAAHGLAAASSATPVSAPESGDRAMVGRSLIRRAGASGSTAAESGAVGWGRIGLGERLSVGSAIPEPGVTVVSRPERGFPGLTDGGPTGLLLVPSARVLRSGWWAAGLHRGVVKASAGLWGVAEAGATAPDIYEPLNSKDWGSRTAFFLKVGTGILDRLGDPEAGWRPAIPILAAGIENSPNLDAETVYGAATWDWGIPGLPTDLHVGWGTGRFTRNAFMGLGVVPTFLLGSTLKVTGEYAGRRGISGIRFAISRDLRLDFAMKFDVMPRAAPREGWSITTAGATLGVSQSGRLRIVEFFKSVFAPRKDARPKS